MDIYDCFSFLCRFRWVDCQIVYLRNCLPSRIRQALHGLPETLDETYNRILREIHWTNWEYAYRLLQCVAVAFRPLEVKELANILSIDSNAGTIPKFHEGWRLENPVHAVLSAMSSLLAIAYERDSEVIQFSHFSVKEYLTSDRLAKTNDINCRRYHISMTSAHTLIAQASLGILLGLDENVVSGDVQENFPLAKYAAEHWVDHAQIEDVSGNIEDGMKLLFDPGKLHLAIWVWIFDPMLPWQHTRQAEKSLEPKTPPLHYAADCGLHAIVEFLIIQHSQDVNSRAFNNKLTPLHLASRHGHEDIARLLLEHGADATAQDNNGWTPLHWTSHHGHEDTACLLLEHGADATAQDNNGWTPLHLASQNGHEDIALALLEHGADANAQDVEGWTPLHQASGGGYVEVTRLLLEHRANTCQDLYKSSSPDLKSGHGDVDIPKTLLEYDVEAADAKDKSWTPLHLASQEGHLEVVRLLVDSGGNPNVKNGNEETPLSLASGNGKRKVAQFLLERGADSNSQDLQRRTPLHESSENGHLDVVLLLLNRGANVNAKEAHLWAPLHMAAKTGNLAVTLELLDRGAEREAQDDLRWTPLHIASQEGHQEVVRLLLNRRAHVDTLEADRETALHLAAYYGHLQVTRLLLDHGADVHALNKNGKIPSELASEEGYHEVAELLLEVEATQPVESRTDRQSVLKAQDHSTSIDYLPPPGASHGPESAP